MSDRISLTREEYLDSLNDLSNSATELTNGLSMTQLTWQPGGGERWSILECFDHLAIFNDIYLAAMEEAAGSAERGTGADVFRTAGLLSTKFTRFAEPPPARKISAPGRIRPRPTLNPEGIFPNYVKTMDRVSAFVRTTFGKDLNSVRFRNPFLPVIRFTVATGLLVIGAHGRRHRWQAEQVIREPDFPR